MMDLLNHRKASAHLRLVREDNGEKPAYRAPKKLIHEDWETHETLMTDSEGQLSFTSFKGDYMMTVNGQKITLNLDRDRTDTLILL
ncbi:MAG: hypothetical protein IJ157_00335 [Clostridia bacterium]|nr:hypothetical protein [Clostridia bacterium]